MMMIFGVVFSAQLGMSLLPFKAVPMIILSAFEGIAGYGVDYLQYMAYAFAVGMVCLGLIVAVGKYVIKPDVALLKNVTAETIRGENALSLNKIQKIILGCLVLLITLLMLPSILPKELLLSQFLNILGPTGVVIMIVAGMVFVKVDGSPLLNFKKMANVGISWDVIMLIAAVMPVSAALTSEVTGFTDFLVGILDPILGGTSPGLFLFLVALIAIIFTNFCNNAATAVALLPVSYAYSLVLGINPVVPAMMIVLCVHLAYLTPAASPSAALMHGNDWINTKTIWQMGMIMVVLSFLVVLALGIIMGGV